MTTIVDRLHDKDRTRKPGKVAFLKYQSEIEEAFKQGWSGKEIWDLLVEDEKISITYQMFLRYCSRFIERDTLPISHSLKQKKGLVRTGKRGAKAPSSVPPKKVVTMAFEKRIGSPAEVARKISDDDVY